LVSDNKAAGEPLVLADALRAELVVLSVRSVEPGADGQLHFHLGDGLTATRAASCMLEPQVGDTVLAAALAGAGPIVIAVLHRASEAPVVVSVPGAAALHLAAPEIALAASKRLTADAPSIAVQAQVGCFTVKTSHFFGDAAFVVVNAFEAFYGKLQNYAEKLITKAGYSLRIVDDLDSTVAATVLVQAKQTYSLQSTQTILTSSQDTRIDGERISMG
jgi:hypothetical protein